MRTNQRAGIAIIKDNKILLIKRKKDNDIYYILPGGGVEADETPKQAAIREVREELSIKPIIEKKLIEFEHRGNIEYYYLAKEYNGDINFIGDGIFNSNITDIDEWVEIDKLSNLKLLPEKVKELLINLDE